MHQSQISQSYNILCFDAVEQYFKEINKFKLLSREEERELAYKLRDGDLKARDSFIQSNLRLVVSIAKNYIDRGLTFLDLIEEGNTGLLKAVKKFDTTEGYRFSTYAVWWIKQSIKRALVDTAKPIRIPSYLFKKIARYNESRKKLWAEKGKEPTKQEIFEEIGLFEFKEVRLWEALKLSDPQSLNSSYSDENTGFEIKDEKQIVPEERISKENELALLEKTLASLNERERKVIRQRYGLGCQEMTLKEIGDELNLTKEGVRKIELRSLKELREKLKVDDFF